MASTFATPLARVAIGRCPGRQEGGAGRVFRAVPGGEPTTIGYPLPTASGPGQPAGSSRAAQLRRRFV
jgi:hypothetical protein